MAEKKTLVNISRDLARLSISYIILSIQTAVVSVIPSLTILLLHVHLITKYENEAISRSIVLSEYGTILSVIVPLFIVMCLVVVLGYVFRERVVSFLYDKLHSRRHSNPTMRQLHHVPSDTNRIVRLLDRQTSKTFSFLLPLPLVMLGISTVQVLGYCLGLFGLEPFESGTSFHVAADMFCTFGMFFVFFNAVKVSGALSVLYAEEFPDSKRLQE